jgi:hypothetical protein
MTIACIGSALLVLLALTGTASRGVWWRTGLVTIVAVALWLFGINQLLPLQNSYPEAMTGRVARYAADQFAKTEASDDLILIEGSSVTARGLNGGLLEKILKEQGVAATVVQISLDGANHVERLEILKQFVGNLSAADREKLAKSKIVFCQEIEAGYDRSPFNHVESNQFTDRTLAYLNVRNLPEIYRWLLGRYGFKEIVQRKDLVAALVTHEFFNLFRIGYFQRAEQLKSLEFTRGFTPNEERRPDFHPEGPLPATVDLSGLKKEEKSFQKFTHWNSQRDDDFRRVLPTTHEKELHFSIPNWRPYDIAYDLWRARHTGYALYFSGNSPAVRSALANPDLWSDPTHLKSAGANLYTEKLAEFMVEQIRSGNL